MRGTERRRLAYLALIISMIYGGLFAVVGDDSRATYAALGAIVVAIAQVSVGMLGRDEKGPDNH